MIIAFPAVIVAVAVLVKVNVMIPGKHFVQTPVLLFSLLSLLMLMLDGEAAFVGTLVRSISAIFHRITDIVMRDAFEGAIRVLRSTGKLIIIAVDTAFFVRSIMTIGLQIADQSLMNTLAITARELMSLTDGDHVTLLCSSIGAVSFISSIEAILIPVTDKVTGDALP